MIRDLKDLQRYPAHLHAPAHDAHTRAATVAGIALAVVAVAFVGGYLLGQQDGRTDAIATMEITLPVPGVCESSGDRHDVIEHTWAHRGAVMHRECIRIERPSYVSPRYSVQTPARIM